MNLIDRERLKKVIDINIVNQDIKSMFSQYVDMQPIVNKWIPVERELPEPGMEVLLRVKSNIPHKQIKTYLGWITVGDKFSIKTDKEDEFYGLPNYYDVIAWMPIPTYEVTND